MEHKIGYTTSGKNIPGKAIGQAYHKFVWVKCNICKKEYWTTIETYRRAINKDKMLCQVCNGRKQGHKNNLIRNAAFFNRNK
jgi:hypothetical protein